MSNVTVYVPGTLESPPMMFRIPVVAELPADAAIGDLFCHSDSIFAYAGQGRWLKRCDAPAGAQEAT